MTQYPLPPAGPLGRHRLAARAAGHRQHHRHRFGRRQVLLGACWGEVALAVVLLAAIWAAVVIR